VSYLSVPTRPPAENWVKPPSEENLNRAYQILSRKGLAVELLTGYEGNAFASTGEAAADLLAITSVHPMREEAVREFLERTGSSWDLVQNLMDSGQLIKTEYQGHQFYLRRLKNGGHPRRFLIPPEKNRKSGDSLLISILQTNGGHNTHTPILHSFGHNPSPKMRTIMCAPFRLSFCYCFFMPSVKRKGNGKA
jgi:Fe-S oxidoreductases